jgi:hypothetical protein
MQHIIVTGGIGAGKTNLIDRITKTGNWIVGSPATTMKRKLAAMIARTINADGSDHGWEHHFKAMLDRHEKERYRGILQGYGEHFSNLDNFFWVRRMMDEVQQEINDRRWSNDFDFVTGTVYDSIRRPQEIIGIREVFPDAVRIHLHIDPVYQLSLLTEKLGYTEEKALATLAHSSEHWLDASDVAHDNLTGAELVIDAAGPPYYRFNDFTESVPFPVDYDDTVWRIVSEKILGRKPRGND